MWYVEELLGMMLRNWHTIHPRQIQTNRRHLAYSWYWYLNDHLAHQQQTDTAITPSAPSKSRPLLDYLISTCFWTMILLTGSKSTSTPKLSSIPPSENYLCRSPKVPTRKWISTSKTGKGRDYDVDKIYYGFASYDSNRKYNMHHGHRRHHDHRECKFQDMKSRSELYMIKPKMFSQILPAKSFYLFKTDMKFGSLTLKVS